MTPFLRPMLAASLLKPNDPHTDESILKAMESLKYPVLASLKKDGIRAIRLDDLRSRTLNLIPNISIRMRSVSNDLGYGFDCELFNPLLSYDEIESIVMSEEHIDSDKIQFHFLDRYREGPYSMRCVESHHIFNLYTNRSRVNSDIVCEVPTTCNNPQELFNFFKQSEDQEGEGICFRLPDSPYKQGRSTLREQYLVKLARFTRTEVTIIGFEEQMYNGNKEKRNAVGSMDRASCKSKLKGKGILGAFIVQDTNGLEFKVGTGVGLTDSRRADIWLEREKYVDKQITIKHKPHGMKVKPRSPVFVGFRTPIDI